MAKKLFLDAEELLLDSFRLGAKIVKDSFEPKTSSQFGEVEHQLESQCRKCFTIMAAVVIISQ